VIVASLAPLQTVSMILVAVGATAVVLTRNVQRQILVNGLYGLLLVVLFVVLAAPDVALSMLVVSTVGYPLVVLIAIARSRDK
jgi:energy-converting hydrogenase B subunit D